MTTTHLVATTSTANRALPHGFHVRLRADLLRADHGRLLVGGSPARVVRLGDRARTDLTGDVLTVRDSPTERLARRLLDGNLANPLVDAITVSREDLTVIVPVRDRAEQLERCLAALAPLTVVVVDDASRDPDAVAEVVARHGASLLPLPVNRGPAGARNAGLELVTTPFVAFVDCDVTVTAGGLLVLARHLADPQVALVGPRVVGRHAPSTAGRHAHRARVPWFAEYDAAASSLDLGRCESGVRPGAEVAYLPSACLVGRLTALTGAGGFDDDWRVAEDVDLVWRLVDAGHHVRYDPVVTAGHDTRPTTRAWLARTFLYGTGGAPLAARHGDKVAPAILSPVMSIGAAALLHRRWWSLPAAAVAIAYTSRRLATALPATHEHHVLSLRLASRGLGWAVRQECGLLLRHWWPAVALLAPVSGPIRRMVTTALLVDTLVARDELRGVQWPTALLARRLDDLAYGAGLWWGALRRGSASCLLPRRARRPSGTTSPAAR